MDGDGFCSRSSARRDDDCARADINALDQPADSIARPLFAFLLLFLRHVSRLDGDDLGGFRNGSCGVGVQANENAVSSLKIAELNGGCTAEALLSRLDALHQGRRWHRDLLDLAGVRFDCEAVAVDGRKGADKAAGGSRL